ncbi:MAG: ATP-binding cassette domain-containing protein [Candidatus Lokiarchaeota archaeon]|nr:ATP-binding cassette domain-containing protein [Candidatus Harpocratesius repetitus]
MSFFTPVLAIIDDGGGGGSTPPNLYDYDVGVIITYYEKNPNPFKPSIVMAEYYLKINSLLFIEPGDEYFYSYTTSRYGTIKADYSNLFDFLTIKENFQLAFDLVKKKKEKDYFSKIMEKIDLKDRETYYPNEFSAGQIQKIAFLLAIEKGSQIILADEPTGNLDANSRDNFMEMIKDFKKNIKDSMIIIVSHDPALMKIADRLFLLENGKCISSNIISASIHENSKYPFEITKYKKPFNQKIQKTVSKLKSLIEELELLSSGE